MRASIIVPCYNVEKYIEAAVNSVLCQTMPDFELILVDDGSFDGTGKLCDELAAKDARVKVIHKKNAGTGLARKTGFEAAKGEYIYIMDPDDYAENTLLESVLSDMDATGADIETFGHYDEVIGNDGKIIKCTPMLPRLDGVFDFPQFIDNFYEYLQSCSWQMWGHVYRHSYLASAGDVFSSQRVGQDAMFHLNLFEKPFNKMVIRKIPYYHYVKKANSTIEKYHKDRFECEYNIAKTLSGFLQKNNLTSKKYRDWSAYVYVNAVMLELNSMANKECTMTGKEKIAHIKEIISYPDVKSAIKNIPLALCKPLQRQIKTAMLKMGMYGLIILSKQVQTAYTKRKEEKHI
ncbi:MAG: glycosyltransferase family 2 protein [Bacillota bacterium]|nr:glycosyltransferase family 2 protein [Bacillota bacterium]